MLHITFTKPQYSIVMVFEVLPIATLLSRAGLFLEDRFQLVAQQLHGHGYLILEQKARFLLLPESLRQVL